MPHDEAVAKWGDVRRAGTHKALNRLIQGSAADVFKAGLAKCRESGVFDVLTPHLLVHDEIDVSVPEGAIGRDAVEEMVRCMETAVPVKLPLRVDYNIGGDWYDAK